MQTELPPETDFNQEMPEAFRLSPQQRFAWRLLQQRCLPNAQLILQIDGSLDEEKLRAALFSVCERYEILRTAFHRVPGMTLPFQTIQKGQELEWQYCNLENRHAQERDREAMRLASVERQTSFDLERGPVVQPLLVKMAADCHWLVLTLPAITTDRCSLRNLAGEIASLLSNKASNRSQEDCLQYIEYAEWQNDLLEAEDQHAQDGRAFWSKQATEVTVLPSLPFGLRTGDTNIFVTDVLSLDLESSLLEAMDRLAAQSEISLEVFLETLWAVLLFRLTETSPLTLGHLCNGRSYPELENALGIFTKTLPIRFRIEPSNPLRLILRGAASAIAEATIWEEYYSAEGSETDEQAPYRFEYEDWSTTALPKGFSIREVSACAESFDLKMGCRRHRDGITLELQYDLQRYSAADIRRLADYYLVLLHSALADPEAPVGSLALLPEAERQQILSDWNCTERRFPAVPAVHHLFEEAAARTPDAPALVFEDQQLTYAQLNARANQLAHVLIQQGIGPDMPVGLCLERSLEMIVGLLGILKAGGAYVPLDPALPRERLVGMLEDSGARLLVANSTCDHLAESSFTRVLLDRDAEQIALQSGSNPNSGVQPNHLVYVIYTSGSTGRPKGVAIEHRQLLNYIHGITDRLGLPQGASYATVSTVSADLGNTSLFPSLCSGGCLHVVSAERAMDQDGWQRYFSQHAIDCLKIVPSHLSALLGSGAIDASLLPSQVLVLGGEASSWELIERIHQAAPALRVFNHYGPTETTVGVLTYAVGEKRSALAVGSLTVPLGRPLANSRMYVLNSYLQPVPTGMAGELYIGGAGVGRGYLHREELTSEKFVHDPYSNEARARMYRTGDLVKYLPDGNLEFLGRLDHQVKIRGYRIELGEIESVLNGYPDVREAIVLAREDRPGEKRLVGYVVPEEGTLNTTALREYLQSKLPGYMVPSALVELKRLPLTPNGKVDRAALPVPEEVAAKQDYVAPRHEVEEKLAEIWQQLLGRERLSIEESFFDLGGHSLLAAQMVWQIRKVFQMDMPLRVLFESPTIARLAEYILAERQKVSPDTPSLVSISCATPLLPGTDSIPMFCVAAPFINTLGYVALSRHLGDEQPLFVLQSNYRDNKDKPYTKREICDMARQYIQAMRTVWPHGPYCLGGMCEGVHIAFEMARQLQEVGEEVGLLVSFDAWPEENTRTRIGWLINRILLLYQKRSLGLIAKVIGTLKLTIQSIRDRALRFLRHPDPDGWDGRYWPGRDFVPDRFNGSMIVFRVEKQRIYRIKRQDLGWSDWVTEKVVVHAMPGDHSTLLREPHVRDVATILRQYLSDVQSQAVITPASDRNAQYRLPEHILNEQ